MKYLLIRMGSSLLTLLIAFTTVPVPLVAMAQTSGTTLVAASSRQGSYGYGYSSSVRRKISALDDDPVEKLPIPILMGVSVANLTKNFADPRDGGARTHEGLDIMAPSGAYIVSPTEAVVTGTGTGANSGKYVYTANPGGERFAYMHLDSIEVKSGDVLKEGDLIGTVGNTGNASGGAPHLHFEIRDGREATDPYPRLTRSFTLEERVDAITEILKDTDDEEEEAEAIASTYRATFIAARAQGMTLPKSLNDALGTTATPAPSATGGFTRDLAIGTRGDDVTALQAFLIAQGKGPRATTLGEAGATGYFGPATQAALVEFQSAVGIAPASGYFGPLTRAKIATLL